MAFKLEVGKSYKYYANNTRYKCVAEIQELGKYKFVMQLLKADGTPNNANHPLYCAEDATYKGGGAGVTIFGPKKVAKIGYAVLSFGEGGLRTIISPVFDKQEAAIPHVKNPDKDLIAMVNFTEEVSDDDANVNQQFQGLNQAVDLGMGMRGY